MGNKTATLAEEALSAPLQLRRTAPSGGPLLPWSRPVPSTAPGAVCRSGKTNSGTWGIGMTASATQGRSTGYCADCPAGGDSRPLVTLEELEW